jgi:hypothetical protein
MFAGIGSEGMWLGRDEVIGTHKPRRLGKGVGRTLSE